MRRKLRIEPADLFAINPRLIYARGHARARGSRRRGRRLRRRPFWSRAGIGHMLSGAAGVVMQRPAQGEIPSGMFLAGGSRRRSTRASAMAAAHRRRRAARGRHLDARARSRRRVGARRRPAEARRAGARASGSALVGTYLTSDGRVLQLNMLSTDKYWQAGCDALEAPDLGGRSRARVGRGPRARLPEIRERFTRAIAAKPLAHWMARLRAGGCIFSSFATPTEVQSDPQVVATATCRAIRPPDRAARREPVQFDETPIAIRRGAPGKGEHTDEVLVSIGIDAADAREAARGGGNLVGRISERGDVIRQRTRSDPSHPVPQQRRDREHEQPRAPDLCAVGRSRSAKIETP